MATHSSILAWRIPWTEEPGGLQSMRLQRNGHDWVIKHTHRNQEPWVPDSACPWIWCVSRKSRLVSFFFFFLSFLKFNFWPSFTGDRGRLSLSSFEKINLFCIFWPHYVAWRNLNSPTRDWTCSPCIGRKVGVFTTGPSRKSQGSFLTLSFTVL